MKTKRGKKALLGIGIVIVAVGLLASEAFPWGWAVHTYIDDHLGTDRKLRNMNEIYGGMAPDVFNYMFSYLPFLSNQTHGDYETGESHFMKVWDAANGREHLTLHGHTSSVNGVAFSVDGRRIASGSGDGTLKVWDAQTGEMLRTLEGHSDHVKSRHPSHKYIHSHVPEPT